MDQFEAVYGHPSVRDAYRSICECSAAVDISFSQIVHYSVKIARLPRNP